MDDARREWWEHPRLARRLRQALEHFNERSRDADVDVLSACRALVQGINVLYNAYDFRMAISGKIEDVDKNDASKLTQLVLAIPAERKFGMGENLFQLAKFEPLIMDQRLITQKLDDPWVAPDDVPSDIRDQASLNHARFRDAFLKYYERGSGYRKMLRTLASLIATFRNNLQHGEKHGINPRDHVVSEVMYPVLQELVR